MTRNKGIDLTKSIAILCVLFIHAGSGFGRLRCYPA